MRKLECLNGYHTIKGAPLSVDLDEDTMGNLSREKPRES